MSQQIDPELVDNPRSDRVRRVAGLASRSARTKQGLFLAEGPQPVREALTVWLRQWEQEQGAQPFPELDALFFDPVALEKHPDVLALLDRVRGVLFNPEIKLPSQARIFLREATPEVLRHMGDAETSQGMLAVCRIPTAASQLTALDAALEKLSQGQGPALLAGMLRLQDPGNAGTIIRTADAAGAGAVVLSPGTVDPWSPKVVRSAAGSHFHLPLFTGIEAADLVEAARARGFQVLAADGRGETQLTELASPAASTLWLLGHEAHGLTHAERELADHRVAIPLFGAAESLNVATAATVCMYSTAMAQHQGNAASAPPAAEAPGAAASAETPVVPAPDAGQGRTES
ncbi:TrmH family RNA methyltransferase [Nesterenkonia lutea]|uniref:TrmH family RNA methyltransferase n=1 Tax=Nesterenkonia lutea TaxID=272919 RepID=A0ABR9JEY9_9MICC|nr:TrmH family RNA methyltransferase [Nesterenkonia lutea]MBE1524497.1 TrmH family RNA methyltransferase [Nesterenkonia lutea]